MPDDPLATSAPASSASQPGGAAPAAPAADASSATSESLSIKPLCFVLMPFGKKRDAEGLEIDFDKIYYESIKPGIEDAGLEPLRADAERTGGVIHTAMFERLLLSEFAVADLTTANANVFYELGVRHTARRNTTLPIFADAHLPFDLNYARALPYKLGPNNSFGPEQAKALREGVAVRLKELVELNRQDDTSDSPLFQVLDGFQAPDLAHLKTDTFRERVRYSEKARQALEAARRDKNIEAIVEVERSLDEFDESEAAILTDILLSYRAFSQWEKMVSLVERMPEVLKRTQMIQEQYGLALNRLKRSEQAKRVLEAVIAKKGKNPETCGILGRVYKDLWKEAAEKGETFVARGLLQQAIDCYVEGFEADWRDYYPGVNAVTLLDIQGDEASLEQRDELLPVVRYSVLQRFKEDKTFGTDKINYWDRATLLELAVLDGDEHETARQLGLALGLASEDWEAETTANNLDLISTARRQRGEPTPWVDEVVAELRRRALALQADQGDGQAPPEAGAGAAGEAPAAPVTGAPPAEVVPVATPAAASAAAILPPGLAEPPAAAPEVEAPATAKPKQQGKPKKAKKEKAKKEKGKKAKSEAQRDKKAKAKKKDKKGKKKKKK